jgi:outer membrane protein assembly factor BamB
VVVAVVLYAFGVRVQLDGGGRPRLRVVESSAQQAERIRQHREAQRAANPTPAVSTPPVAVVEASGADEVTGDPALVPEADASAPAAAGDVEAAAPPVAVARHTGYWTGFRGSDRRGEYREAPLRVDWPAAGLTPIWKQPVGGGYASFSVANGRAFTIEQRGPEEVVAAYDVASGFELWTVRWTAEFREAMGGDGPRATPAWAGGLVYALGATGELRALDEATGAVRWRTNILDEAGVANLTWGMAASPLVVDDLLIVLPGAPGGSVVAYDRLSGARRWASLGDRQSYASPMLATLGGVRQLLVVSAERLMGLSVEDGTLLWDYAWPGPNGINAAQPLVLDDRRVFVSSGYGMGAAMVELTAGADGRFSVREVWRNNRMKNRFASSVLHEGYIYGLDESILACMDAETGELVWKGGRYGYGQLVLADDRLIVLTEDGDLALVRATPERHDELVRFRVLSGKTWNPPAIDGGFLLVRNLAEMAAFDLRVP